jgi:hypothetical protein
MTNLLYSFGNSHHVRLSLAAITKQAHRAFANEQLVTASNYAPHSPYPARSIAQLVRKEENFAATRAMGFEKLDGCDSEDSMLPGVGLQSSPTPEALIPIELIATRTGEGRLEEDAAALVALSN